MILPLLIAALVFTAATLLLASLGWGVLRLRGRRPARFWRRTFVIHAPLFVVHLFGTLPILLGVVLPRLIGTRGDEADYAGPRIAADGTWQLQTRDTLKAERAGRAAVDPALARAAAAHAVRFVAADGVALRGFLVAPREGTPRFVAVLAHGLFRNALELEPVGAMLRDLGGEVLLLEWRNHGGSDRARPTYGRDEAQDVLAAVAFLRARPEAAGRPLVLFGVSLGTAAVALAAPRIPDLAALILDAPMDDLRAAADRMLGERSATSRRSSFPQPWRATALFAAGITGTIDFDAVRPIDAVRRLPPSVAVLVIGAGRDQRMPPATVEALFAALPQVVGRKQLWIETDADHGHVWRADPDEYRRRLAELLASVR